MSSKKKGGGGGGGEKEEEDLVQAIVIADSFNRYFSPITFEKPRALLPLANKVLIDYTIEYLLEEGIHEIVVFCCSHAEKIREYVLTKWCYPGNKFNIHCVMSSASDCLCIGDALREIDREGLIRNDFVLVHGDLLSNVKLSEVIKEHKERRKKEKNLMMTMLHRSVAPSCVSRTTAVHDDVYMILEADTNRILHYQKPTAEAPKLVFPTSLMANRKEVNIHYDLVSCNIYICSPHFPPLFTDNFDYQTLDDLVRGVLLNEEILGDKIHSHLVTTGYSARVHDLPTYNEITMAYLNRWIYPVVPSTSHTYKRNNVYIGADVTIELDCNIKDGVMVGEHTTIGTCTSIKRSVIGPNCKIGHNVEIKNSFLWDGCVVEDGASIVQTVMCANSQVKANSRLLDSIVSYNVCIDANMDVPRHTRVSMLRNQDIEEQIDGLTVDDEEEAAYDTDVVGTQGKGYKWLLDELEEEVVPCVVAEYAAEESEDSSDEEEDEDSCPPTPPIEYTNVEHFHMEVVENLRSGIAENIAADNIALEINASKFKYNISISELCCTVVKAMLEVSLKEAEEEGRGKQEMVKEMHKTIGVLHPLLFKYFNQVSEQGYAVVAAEEYFAGRLDTAAGVFATYLHKMYDGDLIDENVILKWFKQTPPDDERRQLREDPNLVKLVTWLEEAEEEDSDEDSEDSD